MSDKLKPVRAWGLAFQGELQRKTFNYRHNAKTAAEIEDSIIPVTIAPPGYVVVEREVVEAVIRHISPSGKPTTDRIGYLGKLQEALDAAKD